MLFALNCCEAQVAHSPIHGFQPAGESRAAGLAQVETQRSFSRLLRPAAITYEPSAAFPHLARNVWVDVCRIDASDGIDQATDDDPEAGSAVLTGAELPLKRLVRGPPGWEDSAFNSFINAPPRPPP